MSDEIKLAVVVEKGEHNYSAYSLDLPGCVSTGETIEETIKNMREAVLFHLEGLHEDQRALASATVATHLMTISTRQGTEPPWTRDPEYFRLAQHHLEAGTVEWPTQRTSQLSGGISKLETSTADRIRASDLVACAWVLDLRLSIWFGSTTPSRSAVSQTT